MARISGHEVNNAERALLVCVETDEAAELYAVEELVSLASTAGSIDVSWEIFDR